MPLPWVRLDTNLPTHDKMLHLIGNGAAGRSAGLVYVFSLSYSGGHATDGLIEFPVLPVIHGRKRDAELLVDVGLWKPDQRGWIIHNWSERQQLSSATAQRRRAQSIGAMKANCIRWHGKECGCWSEQG